MNKFNVSTMTITDKLTIVPQGNFSFLPAQLNTSNVDAITITIDELKALNAHSKCWKYEEYTKNGIKRKKATLVTYVKPVETDEQLKSKYRARVLKYIREKYSASDENKILREKLAGLDTGYEFETYNTYVEYCKTKAHTEVYGE
jgi:hypothetical protein